MTWIVGPSRLTRRGATRELRRRYRRLPRTELRRIDQNLTHLLGVDRALRGSWANTTERGLVLEMQACQWMKENGWPDASATPPGADGGIDIVARKALAQAKAHDKNVGTPDIHRFIGATANRQSQAKLFFAYGYTAGAEACAREHGIQLYVEERDSFRRLV